MATIITDSCCLVSMGVLQTCLLYLYYFAGKDVLNISINLQSFAHSSN